MSLSEDLVDKLFKVPNSLNPNAVGKEAGLKSGHCAQLFVRKDKAGKRIIR